MLGSILYHLISDPIRATALLASLNSNSINIDEALYLQEEEVPQLLNSGSPEAARKVRLSKKMKPQIGSYLMIDDMEDDLNGFDWETAKPKESRKGISEEVEE